MKYFLAPEITDKRMVLKACCSQHINCDEVVYCEECAFNEDNVDNMPEEEVDFYYQHIKNL